MSIPDLDNLPNSFFWAHTKNMGVWRMLQKQTDRQWYGFPWKDIESHYRIKWSDIKDRYDRLERVRQPE